MRSDVGNAAVDFVLALASTDRYIDKFGIDPDDPLLGESARRVRQAGNRLCALESQRPDRVPFADLADPATDIHDVVEKLTRPLTPPGATT